MSIMGFYRDKFTEQALGLNSEAIDFDAFEAPIHYAVIEDLRGLKEASVNAGFHLSIASGYRNFARQLVIWNEKVSGKRPIVNKNGKVIEVDRLTKREVVQAILIWSALPGASRHHWGTDFDIYDQSGIPQGYSLQLTVEECDNQFKAFYRWLEVELGAIDSKFFRPYMMRHPVSRYGVADEPWHLSHIRSAGEFEHVLTSEVLYECIERSPLLLKSTVLEHFKWIFNNYVAIGHHC